MGMDEGECIQVARVSAGNWGAAGTGVCAG